MKEIISMKELMARWGCSSQAIKMKELAGYLHRCPHVPGTMYPMRDVLMCEGLDKGIDPLSPYERHRLESALKEKDETIQELKTKIRMMSASIFKLREEVEAL